MWFNITHTKVSLKHIIVYFLVYKRKINCFYIFSYLHNTVMLSKQSGQLMQVVAMSISSKCKEKDGKKNTERNKTKKDKW